MSSNIPSALAYGLYASHLIPCARCSNYVDLLSRHSALVIRLLSQGYKINRLSNIFKKFYGRHTDLVGQYKKSVCQMFAKAELIKLAGTCMRQITLTLSRALGDYIDYLPMYHP